MRSRRLVAFGSSRSLGTVDLVCLPKTQWVHLPVGGMVERSIDIPFVERDFAMSIIVRTLQCPSRRCQFSMGDGRFRCNSEDGRWAGVEKP